MRMSVVAGASPPIRVDATGSLTLDAEAKGVFDRGCGGRDYPIGAFCADRATLTAPGGEVALARCTASIDPIARAGHAFSLWGGDPPRLRGNTTVAEIARVRASGAVALGPIATGETTLAGAARWLTEHLPIDGWFGATDEKGGVSCAPSKYALPDQAEPLPPVRPEVGAALLRRLAKDGLIELPRGGIRAASKLRKISSGTCRMLEGAMDVDAWTELLLRCGVIDVFGDDAELQTTVDAVVRDRLGET